MEKYLIQDCPKKKRIEADWYVQFEPEKQKNSETGIRLKETIQKAIGNLQLEENEILLASYGEGRKDRKDDYDLENRLFYNIKANETFHKIAPEELVFQKIDSVDEGRYVYEYELVTREDAVNLLRGKKLLAKWENVEIKTNLPNKPQRYYDAIRSNASQICFQSPLPAGAPFGIKIELTVPSTCSGSHPVSVMKPLLDGVICAFHGEDGETKAMVSELFGEQRANELLTGSENLNLLGNRKYLKRYQNGFKWNPADEARYLRFGWIIVKLGDTKEYKMSGSIYQW